MQVIMDRMDSRTAATAAATCKQLAAAYRNTRCWALPKAVRAFQAAISAVQNSDDFEDMGDGSIEASFSLSWPLEGSAVAGADLKHDGQMRMMRAFIPSMLPLLAALGGENLNPDAALAKFKESDSSRSAPQSNSSPLALFLKSEPVALHSSVAAAAAAAFPDAATPTTEPQTRQTQLNSSQTPRPAGAAATAAAASSSMAAAEPSAAPAPMQAPSDDALTAACCNVQVLSDLSPAPYVMHTDGDLAAFAFSHGYKLREPGLGAAVLRGSSGGTVDEVGVTHYRHGLFNNVSHVCADADNGLIWCAADDGCRIKAFRAPKALGGPRNVDAACNRTDNKLDLQYTLWSRVKGLGLGHAGLHVIGTKVTSINTSGAMFTWNIADLAPQEAERDLDLDDDDDDDDVDDTGSLYKGDTGWRDLDDCDEIEYSKGVAPHQVLLLQKPAAAVPAGSSGRATTASSLAVSKTCLLAAAGNSSSSRTMAAVCSLDGASDTNIVLTYDLETQQVKNLFLGHLFIIEDIAAGPSAWSGAENLFATCARSGDVKLWDCRCRGGAAAITLINGSTEPLSALALASNSSSSSNQLGSGMICFAGGANEAVTCWDVRASQAQALYHLSTGNLMVNSLAWHEGSSSLIAACESKTENRFGECSRDDFFRIRADGSAAPGAFGGAGGLGGLGGLFNMFGPGHDDEDDEAYDEDDEDDDEDAKWWPKCAKHSANDFKEFFNRSHSCVLAYTFSDKADKAIPPSDQPYFCEGW